MAEHKKILEVFGNLHFTARSLSCTYTARKKNAGRDLDPKNLYTRSLPSFFSLAIYWQGSERAVKNIQPNVV